MSRIDTSQVFLFPHVEICSSVTVKKQMKFMCYHPLNLPPTDLFQLLTLFSQYRYLGGLKLCRVKKYYITACEHENVQL